MTANSIILQRMDGSEFEVPFFMLLQWKGAIGLEMKGLKNSRGSVTAHVRKVIRADRKYTAAMLHEWLTMVVDEILEVTVGGIEVRHDD